MLLGQSQLETKTARQFATTMAQNIGMDCR
jgi:hypothetical protein